MPLREDLLEPIAGDNPSGANLQYDKVFDQIKEARIEDDDSIPMGNWEHAPRKADRPLVIKLASEALATKTKDLRLAGWLIESQTRREGFGVAAPGMALLLGLQEQFWDTLYPLLDEDGNADLRVGAIESAANMLAVALKKIEVVRGGIDWAAYQDARALGLDSDSRSDDKNAARKDAIARGKMTGDELQKSVDSTPKAFYAESEKYLMDAVANIDALEVFCDEKYGNDSPSFSKLKSSVEDVKKIVTSILNEKRKTDPDPVEVIPEEVPEGLEEGGEVGEPGAEGEAGVSSPSVRRSAPAGAPGGIEDAYLQVAACADFLSQKSPASAVPYLLCTALRLGETRSADLTNYSFPVAPPTEVRQAMRKLANEQNWAKLMELCIRTLPEPCGRVWLDLQRYTWTAAKGAGNETLAKIVVSTVRSLITDLPNLRLMTLNDDTSAANPETQQWLETEVLRPPE